MALNVLILPDKFKGTLTAQQAATAVARGWRRIRPQDRLDLLPMSDGGDGFGAVMGLALGATQRRCAAVDAAGRPCHVSWWWEPRKHVAIIESAKVIGLAMLPPRKFHPFDLDTTGLGIVIRKAISAGAKEVLLGIGGSATNDGGFGMARAFGWRFLRKDGVELTRWTELNQLTGLKPPAVRLNARVRVAVDVENPLCGKNGATRVYGPQKGLRPADFRKAENCLGTLARVARKHFDADFSTRPGAGAAGGLGFGAVTFATAHLESGFELFAKYSRMKARLRDSDVVVTAEGAMDRSTLMGKGVGRVGQLCREKVIHCVGLCGARDARADLGKLFDLVLSLTEYTNRAEAMSRPAFWLERMAREAARLTGSLAH